MADYAFIIGIEEYIGDSLPKVRYAEADAKEMAAALEKLRFTVDTLLLSKDATKTNIEHKLSALFETLTKNDRLLLYYAGHGFAAVGHTVLSSAETTSKAIEKTGVSLEWIMKELDKTPCTKWMFFLDACHAGAVNLHNERSVTDTMSEKEIKQFFEEADHKVCFAACKFSQKSLSASALKHGVWTYHILKSLRGEEDKALMNGKYLTAQSLQDYLQKTVPVEVKKLLTPDAKQTPVMYGSLTNNFEIADLGTLIAAQNASSHANAAYRSAEYQFAETVSVDSLIGFKRGHTVPTEVNSYTQSFVERAGAPDVEERVKERFAEIKKALSLTRTEIQKEDDRIITKDFEYAIWCEQDNNDPGDAIIYEKLSGVSPDALEDDDLNEMFDSSFDEMVLTPKKKINVDSVIDAIEALRSKEVLVEYDPDCKACVIRLRETDIEFEVRPTSVIVRVSDKTNPVGLIEAFASTRRRLVELAGPTMRLLS